jgi:hypothetical protein
MANVTPLAAIQKLLGSSPEGEAVENLQVPLYTKFGLKLSYRAIEDVFLNNTDLFSQEDGRWIIRKEN